MVYFNKCCEPIGEKSPGTLIEEWERSTQVTEAENMNKLCCHCSAQVLIVFPLQQTGI